MINLMLGQPGGGKSYESVAFHVIPAVVEQGRKVITNLPLRLDMWDHYFPGASRLIEIRRPRVIEGRTIHAFSQLSDYGDPWRHPETGIGPLYIIDECHKSLPRLGTPVQVEEWFAEHRHEVADVLLITQSYGKINQAIRDAVQLVYRCKKATAFGSNDRYIRKVQDGLRGEVVNTTVREYEGKFFPLYKSHTKTTGFASEALANDIVPLWKRWPFKGAAICLVLFLGMVVYITGYMGKEDSPPVALDPIYAAPVVSAITSPVPDVSPQPQAPPAPRGPDKQTHPYHGYGFHLAALMHRKRDGQPDYLNGYVTITQNGQPIRQVSFRDLEQAGYSVEYESDTVIGLRYRGIDLGFVVSGLPTIKLAGNLIGKETDG